MTTQTPPADVQSPSQRMIDSKHLVQGEKMIWESRPAAVVVLLKPVIIIILALIYASVILTYNGSLAYMVAALVLSGLLTPFDRRFGIPAGIAGGAIVFLAPIDHSLAVLVFVPVILGALPLITTYLQWRNTVVTIADRRIISQYGFLSQHCSDTGLDNVQKISLKQLIVERIFGFGDITITTLAQIGRAIQRMPGLRFHSGGWAVLEDVPKPFEIEKLLTQYVYRPVSTGKPITT